MSALPLTLPFKDIEGREVAKLMLWPTRERDAKFPNVPPVVELSEEEARRHAEYPIQLRERERYVYRVEKKAGELRELNLIQGRGISRDPRHPNDGTLEIGDFSGVLPLRLCDVVEESKPIGVAFVEVRSLKLGYREDYRCMLSYISEKAAALLLDSQGQTQNRLSSDWTEDSPFVTQQLEFLRQLLDSSAFHCSLEQIFRAPHQKMEHKTEERTVSRVGKIDRSMVHQLSRGGGTRIGVPRKHPLQKKGLKDLPRQLSVVISQNDFDTAENRFIKSALVEFQTFLSQVARKLEPDVQKGRPDPLRLYQECERLGGELQKYLQNPFFKYLGRPQILPFGSPVLQRKAGYRELFRSWLQFHASAQLKWDGGKEIWNAGARDVASLYEYWLFFQLESLFRKLFKIKKPLHQNKNLVDVGENVRLKLKRGQELMTSEGVYDQESRRRLKARFLFNKKFSINSDRQTQGSWTRGVQPDYTISIWPEEFTIEEAEKSELMVHIHFDAKYRVSHPKGLDGETDETSQLSDDANGGSEAVYSDLLKMHAYRDAIRRTGGAYVLYPGEGEHQKLKQFHEILPGLGAFSVTPSETGNARGLENVELFLKEVIQHLSNRTTQYERLRFHTNEAMAEKDEAVNYEGIELPEKDHFYEGEIALPPSEHHVLVAWYEDDAQLEWVLDKGLILISLGTSREKFHVEPVLGIVRHVLLRTHEDVVADGLWKIQEAGFKIFTNAQVEKIYGWKSSHAKEADVYAVFQIGPDSSWATYVWDGEKVKEQIKIFERRKRNKPVSDLGHSAANPRILSLKDLKRCGSFVG